MQFNDNVLNMQIIPSYRLRLRAYMVSTIPSPTRGAGTGALDEHVRPTGPSPARNYLWTREGGKVEASGYKSDNNTFHTSPRAPAHLLLMNSIAAVAAAVVSTVKKRSCIITQEEKNDSLIVL